MRETSASPSPEEDGLLLLSGEAAQVDLFGVMDAETIAFVFNSIYENEHGADRGPTRFPRPEGYSIIKFVSRRLDWHQTIPMGFLRKLAHAIHQFA